jgi:hypothetical protein
MNEQTQKTEALEHAVMFSRLDALLGWREATDRVYFGHEFCQRLLPAGEELMRAAKHVSSEGHGFTFVTPFVSNAGLRRVQDLVGQLVSSACAEGLEIVVNDWGVLHWLRREHPSVSPVLGRLLSKQKRGPQILHLTETLPPAATDHFCRANVDTTPVSEFLRGAGVQRVELDNLLQGIRRDGGLSASLYYPYGYVTTTRLCVFMGGDRPDKDPRSIGTCSRECFRYDVSLRHDHMPVPLLLRGNTQFFHNDTLPDNLQELNITRLVHQPALP